MKRMISVLLACMILFAPVLPCRAADSQTECDISTVLLTAEEAAYVSAHQENPLVVAISEDLAPVEFYDDEIGAFSGFIIELYELIAQKTGLRFSYVLRSDSETTRNQIADGKIQLVGSLSAHAGVADALNVTVSNPFYSNTVSLISKNSWSGEENPDSVVAVKAGYPVFVEIAKSLGCTSIVEYDSFAACVKAVNDDKADITLISTTGENVLLGHAYYANLTSILLTQTSGDYAIGIANNEDMEILRSIINKALADISPEWISQTRLQWVLKVHAKRDFKDTIYENRTFVFTLLFATVIVIFIVLLLRSKQKRRGNLTLQKSNEQLQKALQEKNIALEAAANANAAKSEFLSNMSHDIRTPMTAILNLTDLALEEINQPEILREDLMKIKLSGNYLMGLINDVLDMSRIESGKMTLKPSVYSHADFVSYMDSLTEPLCEQQGVSFG